MKKIEDFFVAEIKNREKISKKVSKYMTLLCRYYATLYYADKTFLVLSGASSGAFLCSFTTVIGSPVRIASLVSRFDHGIDNMFLKTMGRKK